MMTRTLQLAFVALAFGVAACTPKLATPSVSGVTVGEKPVDQSMATRGHEVWVNKGCYTCHGMGMVRAAPDLLGIMERRDHDWLRKWLLRTDSMILSDDAQVKAMLEQWRGYKMPNMKLQPGDVEALFHYMAAETAKLRASGK